MAFLGFVGTVVRLVCLSWLNWLEGVGVDVVCFGGGGRGVGLVVRGDMVAGI